MRNLIFKFSISIILLSACGKPSLCDKKYDLPQQTWVYQDTLNFAFEVKDTMALYDMVLNINHRSDYAYRNIYTKIYTQFPDNQRIQQVLSLDLSEPNGKSVGKCSGDKCLVTVVLQPDAFFNKVGKYELTLAQFMRADSLKGIENIAFRVTDTGKKRDLAAEAAAVAKKGKKVLPNF
jgi:gliding motility-associated lipoprotein GldH